MLDIIFVAVGLGFFLGCAAYVSWLDRFLGPTDELLEPSAAAHHGSLDEQLAEVTP